MLSFYLSQGFNKPFNSLNKMDIFRMIMAGVVELASMLLVFDTFLRFKEISNAKKWGLLLFAILCSTVYFLFLIVGYHR
jgi:hypothetical protein